jgi:hypothetical protein
MGRSFRIVRPDSNLPEFSGSVFLHKASSQRFTASRRDGKFYLRRDQAGFDGAWTNILERQVHYVFGSGNHARSYLHRNAAGRLVQLPLTWYPDRGGYWEMSPGYDRPDHPGFTREITYRCMFCHNGYPEIEAGAADWDGAAAFPADPPEGIDCQRCHGPGAKHVAAAGRGSIVKAIVNPGRLDPERQMEVCIQCHLETTSTQLPAVLMRYGRGVFSYRPGEPLESYALYFDHAPGGGREEKFEIVGSFYRLKKSACFSGQPGNAYLPYLSRSAPRAEGRGSRSALCKSLPPVSRRAGQASSGRRGLRLLPYGAAAAVGCDPHGDDRSPYPAKGDAGRGRAG